MTRGLRCQPDVLEATQLRLAGRVTARQVVPLKAKTQVGLHATHLPQPAHHITELAGGGTAHLRMFQLPHDSFSLRNSVLYNAALSLRTLARPATSTGNLPILLFQDLRKSSRVSGFDCFRLALSDMVSPGSVITFLWFFCLFHSSGFPNSHSSRVLRTGNDGPSNCHQTSCLPWGRLTF